MDGTKIAHGRGALLMQMRSTNPHLAFYIDEYQAVDAMAYKNLYSAWPSAR